MNNVPHKRVTRPDASAQPTSQTHILWGFKSIRTLPRTSHHQIHYHSLQPPFAMPQRTPLAPTSQSRRKRQELTRYERGRIIQAHMDGVSIRKIAQLMNRPSSTIGDTIKQAPSRPQGASQPRSGRPKQYTERDTRRIIRLIKSKPFWSYRRVLHELDVKLSPATMHRILKPFGIRK